MWIVFDLSGVVFSDGLSATIAAISSKYKIDQTLVEEVLNGEFSASYREGTEPPEAFWKRASSKLSITDIGDVRNTFFTSYKLQLPVVDLIERIRQQVFKIGYISNGPKDRTQHLKENTPFSYLFDAGVFSYEVGSRKPQKHIYESFISLTKADPDTMLYVDDREVNLQPATKLGMKVHLFKSASELEEAIMQLKQGCVA